MNESGPFVINMYSQTSLYPSHTSYDAMVKALTELRECMTVWSTGNTVGFPFQLGSGLADGDWNIVKAIILSVFSKTDFNVVIAKLPEVKFHAESAKTQTLHTSKKNLIEGIG